MLLQQFCGVNILAYYSSVVYRSAAPTNDPSGNLFALLVLMGFGLLNFFCAFPAVWWIDLFSRRSLLLATFPVIAIFQFAVAFGFEAMGRALKALVVTFSYAFAIAYSVGEGPAPFTYASEALPLYSRDFGMGVITAINWLLKFLVAFTWPPLSTSFGNVGRFIWFACWCAAGVPLILFLVPETARFTLEELDTVFSRPYKDMCQHGLKEATWYFRKALHHHSGDRPVYVHHRTDGTVDDAEHSEVDLRPIAKEITNIDDDGAPSRPSASH